mmetsp:Transcript_120224/g.347445  ORF Transcript_120224/g.347445 Transcript_120224/m.347445 type:complete len:206 (-) Transcript_120224:113-730(-)
MSGAAKDIEVTRADSASETDGDTCTSSSEGSECISENLSTAASSIRTSRPINVPKLDMSKAARMRTMRSHSVSSANVADVRHSWLFWQCQSEVTPTPHKKKTSYGFGNYCLGSRDDEDYKVVVNALRSSTKPADAKKDRSQAGWARSCDITDMCDSADEEEVEIPEDYAVLANALSQQARHRDAVKAAAGAAAGRPATRIVSAAL